MNAILLSLVFSQSSATSVQDVFCTGDSPAMTAEWVSSPKGTEAVAISCACNCTGPENTIAIVDVSSSQPRILLWAEELRSYQLASTSPDHWPSVKFFADSDDSRAGAGALVDSASASTAGEYGPKGKVAYRTNDGIDKSYLEVVAKCRGELRKLADAQLKIGYDLGLGLFKKKKIDKAIEQLQFTTSKLPVRSFTVPILNDLGFFLEQANRAAEAIPVLERVVAFDPTRTPAFLNLADAYQKSGEKAKAAACYQRYVELMEKSGKGTKVPARVREYLKS